MLLGQSMVKLGWCIELQEFIALILFSDAQASIVRKLVARGDYSSPVVFVRPFSSRDVYGTLSVGAEIAV
jgi:hypothetical protein